MSDYVIGDVQGCYEPLMRLLDEIQFNERSDTLWFVGDLVNRGPHSLEVLHFIRSLASPPVIVLGNHDLHLLSRIFLPHRLFADDDTLTSILLASDKEELGHWLRQQPLMVHNPQQRVVLCHAGIAPMWTLEQAKTYAREVETHLRGEHFLEFLSNMYGNQPDLWQNNLQGFDRLRIITNYFTRMRFCNSEGRLILQYKGNLSGALAHYIPWYLVPNRPYINADILFGHWAALKGICPIKGIYALDTGCYWGENLTALRLQDKQRFSVKGLVQSN